MKNCIACGMPMKSADDHAMGDTGKDYCRYCARPDGGMQDYQEKLASMTAFLVRTSGHDEDVARAAARKALATLPAWAGKET